MQSLRGVLKMRASVTDNKDLMAQLIKGAFLTVSVDDEVNTMTIGWATIGHMWRLDVFMVAVRDSRHTFSLIEKSDNFTVSVPADDSCKKALAFCGTKSGREYDKFSECNLKTLPGRHVSSPVIDIPGTHFECRIVYKSPMEKSLLDASLMKLYPDGDFHTLYLGEILESYYI
jgi:flavin reductase (DIM6/NTAB) family NADH-FMN oxidoreductase RutF